jgi:hypothetical protein
MGLVRLGYASDTFSVDSLTLQVNDSDVLTSTSSNYYY